MLSPISLSPNFSGGVMPTGRGCVIVHGKLHPVIRVPDNNPLKASLVQQYKDVVFIDGKMYPVKQTRGFGCDSTTGVVVVDGKTYRVNKNVF